MVTPITAVRYKNRALCLRVGLNEAVRELYRLLYRSNRCLNKDELTGLESVVLVSVLIQRSAVWDLYRLLHNWKSYFV